MEPINRKNMEWLPEDIQYLERTVRTFPKADSFASYFFHATGYSWWPGWFLVEPEKKRILEIENALSRINQEAVSPNGIQLKNQESERHLKEELGCLYGKIKSIGMLFHRKLHAMPQSRPKQIRRTLLGKMLSISDQTSFQVFYGYLKEAGFILTKGKYMIFAVVDKQQGTIYDLREEFGRKIPEKTWKFLEQLLYQFPWVWEEMGMSEDEAQEKRWIYQRWIRETEPALT